MLPSGDRNWQQMKDHNSITVMIFYPVTFSVGRWQHGFRMCFEICFILKHYKIAYNVQHQGLSMFLCQIEYFAVVAFGIYGLGISTAEIP